METPHRTASLALIAGLVAAVVAALTWLLWPHPPTPLAIPPGTGHAAPPPASGSPREPVSRRPTVAPAGPTAPRDPVGGAAAGATFTLEVTVVAGDPPVPVPAARVWSQPGPWPAGSVDRERSIRQSGAPQLTDARGVVRLRMADVAHWILARHRDRVGDLVVRRPVDGAPQRAHVLELHPEHPLHVRVMDLAGEPVRGLNVHATFVSGSSALAWPRLHLGESAGPDAGCTWPDLGMAWRDAVRRHGPLAGVRIEGHLPGQVSAPVTTAGLPAPGTTLELQVPLTGSLDVRLVDPQGQPAPGRFSVSLRAMGWGARPDDPVERQPRPRFGRVEAVDGRARFPHVPLGQAFSVGVMGGAGAWRNTVLVEGPTLAQRQGRAELVVGVGHIVLRGQALDAAGTPLANATLYTELEAATDPQPTRLNAVTDDAGGFLLVLPSELAERPFANAELAVADAQLPQADLTPWTPFRVGVTDVGALRFTDAPVLVAGRVRTAPGAPCTGYRLEAEQRVRGSGEWRPLRARSRIDGETFAMFRDVPRTTRLRLRIEPASRCHVTPDPIEFSPGTTDLVVQLDPGHTLAAELRVPDVDPEQRWIRLRPFTLQLRPTGGEALEQFSAAALSRHGSGPNPAEGWFEYIWNGLVPGEYRLEAAVYGADTPFRVVDGIRVPGPDGTIARTRMDLLADLQRVVLRFRQPDGQPPKRVPRVYLFHGERMIPRALQNSQVPDELELMVLRGVMDAWVMAIGYAPTMVRALDGDREVTLRPTLTEVRVQLTPPRPAALPEGVRLRVSLEASAGFDAHWEIPAGADLADRSPIAPARFLEHSWPVQVQAELDGRGSASLTVYRSGVQRVVVEVIDRFDRVEPVVGVTPPSVSVQSGESRALTVGLPAAGLRDALQRLQSR
ncbi:MAG: hypothetical protein AAF628_17870 [Planctomycetota bacterium]